MLCNRYISTGGTANCASSGYNLLACWLSQYLCFHTQPAGVGLLPVITMYGQLQAPGYI